jgi:hypothetical protein
MGKPGKRLQINWPYVATVALIGSTSMGFIAWGVTAQAYRAWARGLPIGGGWNWPLVIVLDVGCLFVLLALFWKIYCDANVEIGEVELSRPSIFGTRRIPWSEIVQVVQVGFGYHIHAENKKIVLSPYAYRHPDSVMSILRARIPGDKGNAGAA